MTGPRGARCTGAGEGPPVCTRRFQETRPGAEPGVTTWRAPRWSAERRARSAERAAAPEAHTGGNIRMRGEAPRDSCAFSALRLPLFFRRQKLGGFGRQNSGAGASRERDHLFHPPLEGEGRAPNGSGPSGRPDGRLRCAGWGARRCRDLQRAMRALTPSRRASRGDLPPPGEGEDSEKERSSHAQTQLSRPAHARTVAGVAAQGARRFGHSVRSATCSDRFAIAATNDACARARAAATIRAAAMKSSGA